MVSRKLRILYHFPNPDTIYAGRTIYFGYKHAFEDLGHEFRPLTQNDNQAQLLCDYNPDIFFTSMSPLTFRYLNLKFLKKAKKNGTKVFVNTPFWKSPLSRFRINEIQSLSENMEWKMLIKSGDFGDVFYNVCEQGDPRMEGFTKNTGYKINTIFLAADKTIIYPEYSPKFKTDISYVGTYLPAKKKILDEQVFPLMKKYQTKIYGQDWTKLTRLLGLVQRGGQYFNVPFLRSFLKPPLHLEDERKIYTSSIVSINIHEDYQKKFLGDINERTFKIPLAGGFEIVDNVPSLKKYFKVGEELIVAENKQDWFEKIDYYIKNPQKRMTIIELGKRKVLADHTYNNRVKQIIDIYNNYEQ